MANYIVGDIHGCFQQLQQLLSLVNFNPSVDTLYCTGDLVNGGPDSAAVLRFFASLDGAGISALGNHDITCLAIASGHLQDKFNKGCGFAALWQQDDLGLLLGWLAKQPVVLIEQTLGLILLHAGWYPGWNLAKLQNESEHLAEVLSGFSLRADVKSAAAQRFHQLMANLHGDWPQVWSEELAELAKLRFTVNACCRMRWCQWTQAAEFSLFLEPDFPPDLAYYEQTGKNRSSKNSNLLPWFELLYTQEHIKPVFETDKFELCFGHWAALQGRTNISKIWGLDTGCMYGEKLTLLDWARKELVSVPGFKIC